MVEGRLCVAGHAPSITCNSERNNHVTILMVNLSSRPPVYSFASVVQLCIALLNICIHVLHPLNAASSNSVWLA